ncbi:hypothetical protein RYT74_001315 [Salmonella enterica]|nr:hypothetical protein [Salmonella enterica]EGW7415328.1 hypothetical protein [Salmonella enterica]EKQ6667518.1 hypothetical protein [Salmonella enterica]ELG4334746.1 hypothetical protein [Salmonella enterica]ELM2237394.1 hypothetical protein [Salmonella enterica]
MTTTYVLNDGVSTTTDNFEAYWDTQKHKYQKDRYEKCKFAAWQAWQASRAAIEIELPTKNDIADDDYPIPDLVDWDDGRNAGIQECAEAIRAAGIKVKE